MLQHEIIHPFLLRNQSSFGHYSSSCLFVCFLNSAVVGPEIIPSRFAANVDLVYEVATVLP